MKKTIAILCGRYLPGYKDGGPVRSLVNLVDCLGRQYHFRIITNDRDHGDIEAYPNIKYGSPNKIGDASVYYLKPGDFHFDVIKKMTRSADLIYICGPYNDYAYKTLFLNKIKLIKKPVVVASMGSFSAGAFQIKNRKKKLFINICKTLGLYNGITWSVTSRMEETDVKRIIGKTAKCIIAEDLPRKIPKDLNFKKNLNTRIVFISRISEMKNLLYAIDILKQISSSVEFDIYGPIEDNKYWEQCKTELKKLPQNILWDYRGMADSEKIVEIFSEYDIFLFPTKGENYGHVIFESLAGGCIPVVSDQTPWQDLEQQGCGKAINLDKPQEFLEEINRLVNLDKDELLKIRYQANRYAEKKYYEAIENTGYLKIFG